MDPIQGQVSNQGFDSKLGFQIRVSNHGWTFEPGLVFQSGASSLGQGSRLQCKAKFRFQIMDLNHVIGFKLEL